MPKRGFLFLFCLTFVLVNGNPHSGVAQNIGSSQSISTASLVPTIQTVLDSVSLPELLHTERDLTGEEPVLLDSRLDTIKTRYSLSPQIYQAQNYIQTRLESYGYSVELFPFAFGTFYDVDFVDRQPKFGWTVSVSKIIATRDGGRTWSIQFQGSTGGILWSVFVLDSASVWVVGEKGMILHTGDEGETWSRQAAPTNDFLFGVFFLDRHYGWICGDNGTILHTSDGGQTWLQQNSSTAVRLYDVFFIHQDRGWVVGRNGTILVTADGGASWTLQSSGVNSRLYGVHFLDEITGFVAGHYGTLLKTSDGGGHWHRVSLGTSSHLYDIDFLNSRNGVVVGWHGLAYRTSNGGLSWERAQDIDNHNLYGCDFVTDSLIWASGKQAFVKSGDFAHSWDSYLVKLPQTHLNDVIAIKNGIKYPDQYYIIGSHYDSISNDPMVRAPGADDNCSGTATVLEAARVLKDYSFNYSIQFVLFAGEEQGLLGSHAYARYLKDHGTSINGVLNLDMIAYDSNQDHIMEVHSGNMVSSQSLGNFLISNIDDFNLHLVAQFLQQGSSGASDHSSFWSVGYPAVMIIEDFDDFTPYYHTTNDRLSTLRLEYFLENAKFAIGNLALLAEIQPSGVSDTAVTPVTFRVYNPYPNPFWPLLNIEYDLFSPSDVVVEIYDLLGRRVKTLVNRFQENGRYHLIWDARSEQNRQAASGIYFIRWRIQNRNERKKIILMR